MWIEAYEKLFNLILETIIDCSKNCKFCNFRIYRQIYWGQYEYYCSLCRENLTSSNRCSKCFEIFGK